MKVSGLSCSGIFRKLRLFSGNPRAAQPGDFHVSLLSPASTPAESTKIIQKRNAFLTNAHMEEIFVSTFLGNLSISKEEKDFIIQNTNVIATIIDPVRGNNITCAGNVARDLE